MADSKTCLPQGFAQIYKSGWWDALTRHLISSLSSGSGMPRMESQDMATSGQPPTEDSLEVSLACSKVLKNIPEPRHLYGMNTSINVNWDNHCQCQSLKFILKHLKGYVSMSEHPTSQQSTLCVQLIGNYPGSNHRYAKEQS